MSIQRRTLAVIFVLSFALDFKGAEGGSPIQFLMAGINSTAFLLLAMSYRMAFPRRGLAAFIVWGWVCFLTIGTLGALVNATPLNQYIRIVYTFTLFLEGFLVAWWVARDPRDARMIVTAMMATAVISLFYTLAWGFYFTGKDLEEIRYQILSPLVSFLIIAGGYDLFLGRHRRLLSLFLLSAAFVIILLSVTRSLFLVIGIVASIVLLVTLWNGLRTARIPRPIAKSLVSAFVIIILGSIVTLLIYPDVFERWLQRSTGPAQYVTFWTRVAAVVGQYDSLVTSPYGWLIGKGFGSSYPWPFSDFPWILPYLGPDASDSSVWFPGEFMWMPFLFYGGFIIGPVVALSLLAGAVRAFRLLVILLRTSSWRNLQTRPLWLSILGYFSFIAVGFTANPFMLRLEAMFLGLCLGLIITQSRLLKIS